MQNTPLEPPTINPPTPVTGRGNNKTVIIIVVAIFVVVAGYMGFRKWQERRAISEFMKSIGIDEQSANMLGKGAEEYANRLAREAATEESDINKSPEEKFADAVIIEVVNGAHSQLATEVSDVIKSVFGDTKITGYTSGYMGMNSGSGVAQYTVPKLLGLNEVNNLSKAFESKNFKILNTGQQDGSATIMAQKDSVTYTISFNKDEQEITVIIIKSEEPENSPE